MTDQVFYEMFIKEPYEKGKQETKIKSAINLLKAGFSLEYITEPLELTQEDLEIIKEAKKDNLTHIL